jgi:hypothetical protein
MAVIQGQRFTWSDSVNEKIDMSSALDILKPTDVPLLTLIGKDSLRDGCTSTKHQWLEEDFRGQTTVVDSNELANTTDPVTGVGIATGDASKFRKYDIVRVENELMYLSEDPDIANDELDGLIRGWGATSAASHSGTPVMTLIASALPQGTTTPGAARTTTKAGKYNYTQIFEEVVTSSATMQNTDKYTAQADVEHQIAMQLESIGINMEKTLWYGSKVEPTVSSAGSMDGIRSVLTTNVYDKNGAVLTQTMLEDALQDVWSAGASSTHLFCNATQKRRINTFLDGYRQAGYSDEKLGTSVTRYETDFGSVTVVLDRWAPADEVLIINSDKIGFGPLQGRSLGMTKLPINSRESDTWQISGEYTAEVRLEKSHALIQELSTATP